MMQILLVAKASAKQIPSDIFWDNPGTAACLSSCPEFCNCSLNTRDILNATGYLKSGRMPLPRGSQPPYSRNTSEKSGPDSLYGKRARFFLQPCFPSSFLRPCLLVLSPHLRIDDENRQEEKYRTCYRRNTPHAKSDFRTRFHCLRWYASSTRNRPY